MDKNEKMAVKFYCDKLGINTIEDLATFKRLEGHRAKSLADCLFDYYCELVGGGGDYAKVV